MNKKALSLAICMAMAIPSVSSALSLGEIQSNSSLNQPFKGKIRLLSTSVAEAKNLRVRVAPPAIFERVGIDRPAFLNSIRFRTTIENGRPVILVSSSQPIHEPFLNFLLEVTWPNGQLLKEYTVLLDPPVLMSPDTAIASNTAGIRAEPRAQGRINRPAVQRPQQVRRAQQQPRRVVRAAAPNRQAIQRQRQIAQRQAAQRRAAQQRRVASTAPRSRSYRVKRGDTLSKIAKRIGYRGVRSEQMMVALFEKNRRAFSKRNMNNLKAGAILTRPSLQEARALSTRKAKALIVAQAREWKQARATALAKKGNTPKTNVATVENKQAHMEVIGSPGEVDKNASSGSAGSANAQLAELRKQLALTTESLTTKQQENQELKSRVAELESLLRKKNRLITLKSEQLKQLEARLNDPTQASQAAGAAVNETPAISDGAAAQNDEGVDIQQQVANDLANEKGEIIRGSNVEDNAQNTVQDTAQANQPDTMVTGDLDSSAANETPQDATTSEAQSVADSTPAVADETSAQGQGSTDILGLLSSPLAMGIGGGSLLALLGGLWFMRRKKGKYEEFDFDTGADLDPAEEGMTDYNTEFGDIQPDIKEEVAETAPVIDQSELVEHDGIRHEHIKNSGLLDDDQEDLLQEADVYIVYGLHDQAETELKEAIAKDPDNLAYRAKLLENYKAAGNKEAFEEEAKVFMALENEGKEKYYQDIAEWGSELMPENKLFSMDNLKKAAAATGVAVVAGTAVAQGDKTQDTDTMTSEEPGDELDGFDLDDVLVDDTDEAVAAFDSEDSLIDDIDIEAIDRDDLSIDDLEEEGLDINNLDMNDLGDLEDEFSLNLDGDDTLGSSFQEIGAETNNTADTSIENDLDLSSFEDSLTASDSTESDNDISFGLDDKMGDSNLSDDITSLNLDLDADDFDKIMPEDNLYKANAEGSLQAEGSLPDEGSIDGVTDNKLEENLLADFDDNLSFLDLDSDDTHTIEETQIDTKLDLAKAYIDMGDIDGARSTLEEVMQEGSEDQKREAEELLHQTG